MAVVEGFEFIHFNYLSVGLEALPLEIHPHIIALTRKSIHDSGMKLAGVSATFNLVDPDPDKLSHGLMSLDAIAASAPQIGTRLVTLCSGSKHPTDKWAWHPDNARPEVWREMMANLEKAVQIAEKHEVVLGIEPEMGNVIRNADLAKKMLREINSPRVAIIFDPANLFEKADEVEARMRMMDAWEKLHNWVVVVHAKDRDAAGVVQPAGKGVVDFQTLVGM
ncbi:MAG: TIM barrel protein, partial [Bacteroidota bacterium]